MQLRALAVALALISFLVAPGGLFAQDRKPPLSPLDVVSVRGVSAVDVSPDGEWIAFVRTAPRLAPEGRGRDHRHLLVVPAAGGEPTVLVGGETRVGSFAWSPDGRWLSLTTSGPEHDHPELYGLATDALAGADREFVRLTNTPHGVGSFRWRPDGGAIAYTRAAPLDDATAERRELGFDRKVVDEEWRDLELWIADVDRSGKGSARRLPVAGSTFDFEWAPDGRWLVAGVAPRNLVDDSYMFTRLHLVPVEAGGDAFLLVDNPGKLGQFAVSPDGAQLAYIGAADVRDPHAGMLWVAELGEKVDTERSQVAPRMLHEGLRGEVHHIAWNDDAIAAAVSVGVHSQLRVFRTDADEDRVVYSGRGLAFRSFDTEAGRTLAFAASSDRHPPELFVLRNSGADLSVLAPVRYTDSNPWLVDRSLGRQEVVRFESVGGVEIEGLLIHPAQAAEGPVPLVIIAHGGPEAHYSDGWLTRYSEPGQYLAGLGFRVWYPNYRSSTGYGVEFAKHDHGDLMGTEFEDHLRAIDLFVERGLVDRERVGVLGGSYGGYTAAWAATKQSAHFAAAVSFVPFTDVRTKWLTSDIPNEFHRVHYEERWHDEQVGYLADRSPLTWASECRTPLLLVGGDADTRVHPSQPFMLYRAVKFGAPDTPVRYVQYPGEGHGNRINTNRYDYLVRSSRWLEHYLRASGRRRAAPPPRALDLSEWKAAEAPR